MSENKAKFGYIKEVIIGGLAGAVVVSLIIMTAGSQTAKPVDTASQSPSPTQSATATSSATPTATAAVCSVKKLAADPRLGNLQAIVVDNASGKTLFDVGGETGSSTASTMKLITAAVALKVLGPNYRVSTKVYVDPADNSHLYFVGAGDPTLSRTSIGKQSVYQNAPKLADLASLINTWASARGVKSFSTITLDSSLFAGPSYESSWPSTELTQGYVSQVTALQVDGDRSSPAAETSPRSTSPVKNAGVYLKGAIGSAAKHASLVEGVVPDGATVVASVTSQPISVWITDMLQVSDNTEAEYLARLVSLASGGDGSFASIDQTFKTALNSLGLDTTGMVLIDGSGESNKNQVTPKFFTDLMKLVLAGGNNFNYISLALPVAGQTGSLAARFTGDNADADGNVFAKTGWINHGYTLAGYIRPKDGSTLTFAVYALGSNVDGTAKLAIDNLVTGFYRCGLNLSQK